MPSQDQLIQETLRTWAGSRARNVVRYLRLGTIFWGGFMFVFLVVYASIAGTLTSQVALRSLVACVLAGALWGLAMFAHMELKWRRIERKGGGV
jgi:hypothetical protein